MSRTSNLLKLIPPGLAVIRWVVEGDDLIVDARSTCDDAACPTCGVVSRHCHSRYQRTLRDLYQRALINTHGPNRVVRWT